MRSARMKILLLLSVVLLSQLALIAQVKDTKLEAAQRADEVWLALVDTGKYAESWKAASAPFANDSLH